MVVKTLTVNTTIAIHAKKPEMLIHTCEAHASEEIAPEWKL